MRKLLIVFAFFLMGALTAAAQETPKVEGFLGYSYVRLSIAGAPSINLNGGSGSLSYNPISALGVVADFGGYHYGSVAGLPISGNFYTYMFGPKLALRRGRFTPFAQSLFGGFHGSVSAGGSGGGAGNGFAMALGGGLDARVAQHLAIRPIQVDYVLFRNSGTNANSVRISTGVVFRY